MGAGASRQRHKADNEVYLQRLDQTSYSLEEKWSKHKRQKDELEEQLEGALAQSAGGAAEELPPDPSDVSCVPPPPRRLAAVPKIAKLDSRKTCQSNLVGRGGTTLPFFVIFCFFLYNTH